MRITFFGATSTVTGSRTLIESDGARVLVDCGLFQGIKSLRQRNWEPPGFHADRLDAILLTHAHIDHSGYLPRLCADGYRGPIYCTQGTRDLLRILLPDSGYLQEEEARHAARHGWSKHHPPRPLYTQREASACLPQLHAVEFGDEIEVAPGLRASWSRAGHIVGSACVRVASTQRSIAFSGDVGRPNDPIMRAPDSMPPADALVVESTYGDRLHARGDVVDQLAAVLEETFARRGAVIVPAFAVGRAQHLLHLVALLRARGRFVDVPAFLDSPMANDATRIFCAHIDDHRLSETECDAMCSTATRTTTPEESMAIDAHSGPMIVISASGMATGGRVLHHLRRFLPDARNTVLLVGFQSAGTRGRSLADGAEEVKIHGEYVPVRAQIAKIDGLSAHADHAELLEWLAASALTPTRVFVNHGEPSAADAMRRRLHDRFGWDAVLPEQGQSFEL